MKRPTLSIITVNFNNNKGLIKTIESVKQQAFTDYEHIIIDAASADSSKNTILKYQKETSKLTYWVSEPDSGIYDGMNKGIQQAQGDYLYFLNSGDCLQPNILQSVPFDGTKYIFGNIEYVTSNEGRIITPADRLDVIYLLKHALPHQACFICRSLFEHQKYSTEFRIVSDWIHTVHNVIFETCSYKHISLIIATVDGSGVSSNQAELLEERIKWIKSTFPQPFLCAFTELSMYRNSELGTIIPLLSQTRKFQKRAKKLLLFLFRVNSIFSFRKANIQMPNKIWDPE